MIGCSIFEFDYHHPTCETRWTSTESDPSTKCPKCDEEGQPEAFRLKDRRQSKIGNPTQQLVDLLPVDHARIDPGSQHGLVPPFVESRLIDLLVDRAYEPGSFGHFRRSCSEFTVDELKCWIDESGSGGGDQAVRSAGMIEADGEIVAQWSEALGKGEGMTNMIGSYWGAIRGLRCAARVSRILALATMDSKKPEVTLVSDVESVCRHLNGDWNVNEEHIKPLVHEASQLYDELDVTTRKIRADENPAEPLLSRRSDTSSSEAERTSL